jgi:hypothetical protein
VRNATMRRESAGRVQAIGDPPIITMLFIGKPSINGGSFHGNVSHNQMLYIYNIYVYTYICLVICLNIRYISILHNNHNMSP